MSVEFCYKNFSASINTTVIFFFFLPIDVIDDNILDVEPAFHNEDKSPLYKVLFIHCYIKFANILLMVFISVLMREIGE